MEISTYRGSTENVYVFRILFEYHFVKDSSNLATFISRMKDGLK